MLKLELHPSDDFSFVEIAQRLIAGAAITYEECLIRVIHIDNWFGERWAGFRGKFLGIAGAHNRSLKDKLVVPPFHPNRVLSDFFFARLGRQEFRGPMKAARNLHVKQASGANLSNFIKTHGIYVWYSANTIANKQGAIMIYFVGEKECRGWYTMFEKKSDEWTPTRNVGISRQEIDLIIDRGSEIEND